jgi:hypothetical protein
MLKVFNKDQRKDNNKLKVQMKDINRLGNKRVYIIDFLKVIIKNKCHFWSKERRN